VAFDDDDEECEAPLFDGALNACDPFVPPFRKVMAANRAEIAVRIMQSARVLP
jgi:hypothetical protein